MDRFAVLDSSSSLKLDCGDMIGGQGELEEVKGRYLFEAYRAMDYDCVTLGDSDVDQGQNYLLRLIDQNDIPFVSANVYYADTNERFLEPYTIIRVAGKRFLGFQWGGLRVGIFGVLQLLDDSTMLPKREGEKPLVLKDPVIVSREVVEELKSKTDFIICLAHTGWIQAKDLARSVAGIDLMIAGHGANVKPNPYLVGDTPIVMPGEQGKDLGVVVIEFDEEMRVTKREGRAQPLEESIEDDPTVGAIVDRYRKELNSFGKGYVPPTSQLDVVRFVGAEVCGGCHEEQFQQWKSTPHADAITTLFEAEQEFNPECLKCHVTGYGRYNGFHSYEKTPDMVNVQCEVCHGSGVDHVNYVNGEDMTGAGLPPELSHTVAPGEDRCVACHNSEHDDEFHFASDVLLVDHSQTFQ